MYLYQGGGKKKASPSDKAICFKNLQQNQRRDLFASN